MSPIYFQKILFHSTMNLMFISSTAAIALEANKEETSKIPLTDLVPLESVNVTANRQKQD